MSNLTEVNTQAEPYVDSKKGAAFLAVSYRTLNAWARTGKVPAYPWGSGTQRRTWRFKLSELDNWMKSRLDSHCRPPLPNRRSK
jgi:excisionase family DNA binding protein